MFAAKDGLQSQDLPAVATKKALIIINMQNDLFYVNDEFYVTKNRDFLPRLREMIPYFRRIGDIIWVKTEAAALQHKAMKDVLQLGASSGQKAEKNRRERLREESQIIDDVSGTQDTDSLGTHPTIGVNMVYPSSRSRQLMSQVSADARAKKREAEIHAFDNGDNAWPEGITKPRKGQRSGFCIAGTKGAEICDELKDLVDETRDLIVTKQYYSGFDQTSLLVALRMSLTTEVYLCGCFTNTGIYTTAADAVQHGLQVTIVEDCLGYRNELKHDEAVRQMADVMGVNGTSSEEVIEESGGRHIPDTGTPSIDLAGLSIGKDVTSSQAALVAGGRPTSSDEFASFTSQPNGHRTIISASPEMAQPDSPNAQQLGSKQTESANKSAAKRARPRNLQEGETIGSGDSEIILNPIPSEIANDIFEAVKAEVDWQKMYHRSGEVPRLVAVQGEVGKDGEVPIYRHPADESPPLKHFTPFVSLIRSRIEELLCQPFNHALVQLYRGGTDNISEHSDKTLDLVRESRIVNVSLGAQRIMTLRTKKSGPSEGREGVTARQTQRIPMPHNSVFVLGPQTNREWLHGVRADKRPIREKTEEEVAFGGGRISLTFRQIGTFHNARQNMIWGSGAKSKNQNMPHPVSNDEQEVDEMLQAFGKENHEIDFDWDTEYGAGFDVVDLVKRDLDLRLSRDPIANLRVRLALSYKSIGFTATEPDNRQVMSGPKNQPPLGQGHGLCNLENPTLKDAMGREIEGDLAIIFYLQRHYSPEPVERAASAELFRCAAQSNELLFLWREHLSNPSASPTMRYRLEKPFSPTGSLLGEVQSTLEGWEDYLMKHELPYVAGQEWTMFDCTFWPVLRCIIRQWGEFPVDKFPALLSYHKRGLDREGTINDHAL